MRGKPRRGVTASRVWDGNGRLKFARDIGDAMMCVMQTDDLSSADRLCGQATIDPKHALYVGRG